MGEAFEKETKVESAWTPKKGLDVEKIYDQLNK